MGQGRAEDEGGDAVTIVDDEDESGPEPTGIICRVWPTGCAHPHLCQDACFDDDLVREREYQEEEP
jgi:hypothetical protein